ncbi:ABC transporter substrate-binding protein [Frankia sp. QA3]|uniref:ABC transporter substrate-binding protein n=1 Tax=Frankia sp. QA3 TaxID=710111 RepID=UPI000269BF71|nr:ABC transporter substrate-binding protein [Frankia sp. QA3]EIV92446.1 ABC-type dipeptide transport system, periplasmic component [Frankia sp. QA3]
MPQYPRIRRRRRSPLWIALPLAFSLALAACSSGGSGGTANDSAKPRPGGTLRFAVSIDPNCLDPQQAGLSASLNIGRQLVDSLTDQDARTGAIRPWLAESWTVSPDATSFTFRLRRNATFSDGTPVDAAAVKTNFDAIVKLGLKAQLASAYLTGYRDTTVVDPYTVKIDFNTPSAQFLQASSTVSLGLLAPASVAKPADQRCLGSLIGSGPFVLDSYRPRQEAIVSKRTGYAWGSSLWAQPGEAYLDKIEYRIIPDPEVRAGSLASGQLDATSDVQPQDEGRFSGNDFGLFVRGNAGVTFNLSANVTRPLVGEEPVRQAVLKGIDRAEIVQTVLSPNYKVATSILAASTPDYKNLGSELAYDPEGAKSLLAAAGWVPGSDGIRTKNGQRLSIDVVFGRSFGPGKDVLQLVQQQLKKIGIDLRLRLLGSSELIKLQKTGDFDLFFYNITRADPDVLRVMYSTKQTNRSFLRPGPLEAALDKEASTIDPTQRKAAVAESQQLIVEHAYAIPLFELAQVHGATKKVRGLTFDPSSRLIFHDTWLAA